jgi:hypothetical protein
MLEIDRTMKILAARYPEIFNEFYLVTILIFSFYELRIQPLIYQLRLQCVQGRYYNLNISSFFNLIK